MIDPQKWTRNDSKQELIESHLFGPFEGSVGEEKIEMGKHTSNEQLVMSNGYFQDRKKTYFVTANVPLTVLKR